ncbi:unnamed protein product [Laminaria digitata]
MVNVRSKRCMHEACTTRPSYNFEGRKKVYCKLHAEDGMVNLSTTCSSTGSSMGVGASSRGSTDSSHHKRARKEGNF